MDPYGNGYVVPDAAGLRLARAVQHSRDAWNRGDTEGAYSTCWIDHGRAPKDDGYGSMRYHYAMLVQTTPAELDAAAQTPPYQVLQQNHQAHILQFLPHKSTAYALFETDWIVPYGLLRRIDTPVMAIVRENTDGILLSVADPDLRLPKRRNMGYLDEEALRTPARTSVVRVELRGRWSPMTCGPELRDCCTGGDVTAMELTCGHGMTVELELEKCR
jgi:hypothetical protein